MDLEAFVEEATVANAVVWLSLQGSGVTGPLQQWLEDYHVPFVGKRLSVTLLLGTSVHCISAKSGVCCGHYAPAAAGSDAPKHSSPEGAPCVCAPRC